MPNALQVIYPYKEHDCQWMFDDDATGLKREPFVYGMDTMLDLLTHRAGIKSARKGVKLFFSDQPFPKAVELLWRREDVGGNWYRCAELGERDGWLCPAMYRYFETAPQKLYVSVEPLTTGGDGGSSGGPRHDLSPSGRSLAPSGTA